MNIPKHIAIIMDGNGRWATERYLPRTAGHAQGIRQIKKILDIALELQVRYLTLYAFSEQNWSRPKAEVLNLMALFKRYLVSERPRLEKNKIRFRVIGERCQLDNKLCSLIQKLEDDTSTHDRLDLVLAISYGGRAEIASAARNLAILVAQGKLSPESIQTEQLARQLHTRALPDPDLLIRTGGEKRISNFLLWQLSYTELIFREELWPSFGPTEFTECVQEYGRRDRRFGTTERTKQF